MDDHQGAAATSAKKHPEPEHLHPKITAPWWRWAMALLLAPVVFMLAMLSPR